VLLTGQKAFDRYVFSVPQFSLFCTKVAVWILKDFFLFSSRRQNEQFLVDWTAPHLDDLDSLERITDPRIRGSMPPKAISSLGSIILLCVKVVLHSLS